MGPTRRDAVAAAGHKWLLSVWGGGFLVFDGDFATDLEPRRVSYRSVADPNAAEYELAPDASRLEIGTASPGPHVALATAMDTIEAIGFDTVESRIERLTDRLKDGLGDRLLSPPEYESGLVTFAADDPEAVVERLTDRGIVIRSLPDPEALRAILSGLGYDPAATVRKERERYDFEGCTVTLDTVDGLGEFVEVETEIEGEAETEASGEAAGREDIEAARERAVARMRDLDLDPDEQIRTSYLGLLLAE